MTAAIDTSASVTASRMDRRAKLVLAVLCAAQFMIALDFSILNVALPTLGRDLHLAQANLQWAVTAFALPSGGFLLLFGRIADLYGRRRLFLSGLVIFTLASLAATLAPTAAVFLAARAVQGLGAAVIVPTGMSLLTTSFAEGPRRDRALGVMGTLMALGFTVGVVLGGVLTQGLGWRSTMALNVVMGVLVLVTAPLLLAESRNSDRPRLDIPGAITVTGGLLALIYALSTAAQSGWSRPQVIVLLVVAVVLLVAFFALESRSAHPLVALWVLRRRTVALGNLGGMTSFAMMSSVIFLCTLYLQNVLGYSPISSGLVFGVMGLAAALGGIVAPRFVGRVGARTVLAGGLLIQAAFTATLVGIGGSTGTVLILITGSAACFGHLGAIVSYGITATSGLADEEQGIATGLVTTAQQVGITVGIPFLSALASARANHLRASGHTFAQATLGGVRLGLGADAVAVLVAALLVTLFLRRPGRTATTRHHLGSGA
jgi:EmrB/QacA subfamily drug resistance transporter